MRVGIIDTGVANLASITAALDRLCAAHRFIKTPADATGCTQLVLPGVGAFGAAIQRLRARELDAVVHAAVQSGMPVLGVCLGMQVLFDSSAESPGAHGLGVFEGTCRRLPEGQRVPHLGWNWVQHVNGAGVVASGHAAYANSFAVFDAPGADAVAWSRHGAPFVAAVERGSVLACQFHPELSGRWGAALLQRWLRGTKSTVPGGNGEVAGAVHRIIPCLDVRDGRVVKGVRFQQLRDAGNPVERAACYERQGADELVMLDIAATPRERETQLEVVRAVRRVLSIPLTVGGGIRGVRDVRNLLAAGADKVSVNTAALLRPSLLTELAAAFGRQCIVLAIDARRINDGWEALMRSGGQSSRRDAVEWAAEGVARGAGEILLTSWDRDGTRRGSDEGLLQATASRVSVPVIASGGIGTPDDVVQAVQAGADAVLAASIFHDGDETVGAVKEALAARGLAVRR